MGSFSKIERHKHEYQRYRALARSLHTRIYATADHRLLIVGGTPNFQKLLSCLAALSEKPGRATDSSPVDLGFNPYCDGELTAHGLQVRSRALCKWSHYLDFELRRSAPNKNRQRQIEIELREIDLLRSRLAELHDWRRDGVARPPQERTPFLLSAPDTKLLDESLAAAQSDHELPPPARLLARVVLWSAGKKALARYLDAISPLAPSNVELWQVALLRKFMLQLPIWRQRSLTEDWKAIHVEIRHAVNILSAQLSGEARLPTRLRGRTVAELCDKLLDRCHATLQWYRDIPLRRIPGALAALAICDRDVTPLPKRLVTDCLQTGGYGQFDRSIDALASEAGKPKYGALLGALDRLETVPEPHQYGNVRKMLAGGASIEEVDWAQRNDLVGVFSRTRCSVAWARAFDQAIREFSEGLEAVDLYEVFNAANTPADIAALNHFLRWLERFSAATLAPKVRKLAIKTLLELVAPAIANLDCLDKIRDWASPPSKPKLTANVKLQPIAKWLAGIEYYQQLAGAAPSVPKSIAKLVHAGESHARELAFLRKAADEGTANERQRVRLARLEGAQFASASAAPARLRRAAEEVFVKLGVDALRAVLYDCAAEPWTKVTGASLGNDSLQRRMALAAWAGAMDESQQERLRQILRAHELHDAAYKQHLPANRKWLQKAAERGIDIDSWLRPTPGRAVVENREVAIAAAGDPMDIFLMGTYFNTCLSLGKFNQMAVLANAYDANKIVLYMRDAQQRVLARQLVAVSSDFGLLTFTCYSGVDHRQTETRDQYIAAMAAFCGRWARRSGLSLANAGAPEDITGLFWHDDGVHAWHAAAGQAWLENHSTPDFATPGAAPSEGFFVLQLA